MDEAADRHWSQDMATRYDQLLGPTIFEPFAVELGARATALRPARVLEVAAGSGRLTRHLVASAPDGVTATDLNPGMVALGRTVVPRATWQVAAAGELPFEDDSFDLVVCQFGVMFFPDKPAAWADMVRVTAPGGTVLVATWDSTDRHGWGAALVRAVESVHPEDPPSFVVRVPHGYHEESVLADHAAGAGLSGVTVERVTLDGPADSVHDIGLGFATGTPLAAELAARGDVATGARRLAEAMVADLGPGPLALPMTALLVTGRA